MSLLSSSAEKVKIKNKEEHMYTQIALNVDHLPAALWTTVNGRQYLKARAIPHSVYSKVVWARMVEKDGSLDLDLDGDFFFCYSHYHHKFAVTVLPVIFRWIVIA